MADAGFRLTVEGEKEFKAALKEIDTQIKANKSELKLLTAEYKVNGESMEELQKVQDALADVMASQKDKIEEIRKQYEAVAGEYGETSAAALELKETLAKATNELAKSTTQWGKNEDALTAYRSGSEQLENALGQIDAQIQANTAQLRLLDAQYDGNAESAEYMRQRNELLTSSISAQEEKVNELKAALESAEKQYGETSTEALGYKGALADAETELMGMKKGLEDSGEAGSGLKDTITNIAGELGINIPPAISGMSAGFVAATAAAAGIVAMLKGAMDSMKEAAAYADDVLTEATISGVETTVYQELKYMEGLMDVSTETFSSSLQRIKRAMDDAANGNDDLAKRFSDLNIEITNTDGSLRDAWDVFLETIDALGDMTNETERDAAAMDLMGRSASDLNPLIEAGAAKMRTLAREANTVGAVFSGDALDAMGAFQDRLDRLSATADAAKTSLGLFLIQLLNLMSGTADIDDLSEAWGYLGDSVSQTLALITGNDMDTKFQERVEAIEGMTESIQEELDAQNEIFQDMYAEEISALEESREERLSVIQDSADAEVEAYRKGHEKLLEEYEETLDEELDAFRDYQRRQKDALDDALDDELDAFEEAHRKKLALIDEEYTERIKLVDEERYNAIKALEEQIDAIDAEIEAEKKAEEEREALEELRRVKEALAEAETAEEKAKAQQDYEKLLDKWRKERIQKERDAQKEDLRNQIDALNEEYDAKVEAIKKEQETATQMADEQYAAEMEALKKSQEERKNYLEQAQSAELKAFQKNQADKLADFQTKMEEEVTAFEEAKALELKTLEETLEAEIKAEEEAAEQRLRIRQENAERIMKIEAGISSAADEALTKLEQFGQTAADLELQQRIDELNRATNPMFAQKKSWPQYAAGTYNHPGGYAIVGEEGPELVDLPGGSKVYPTGEAPYGSVVNNWYVTIPARDVKEFNDVVRIANQRRQSIRMSLAED